MDNLTLRQEMILKAVVEYHIATGRPVGSKFLCRQEDFGVAPSTVRHELARLEEMGYLSHPYTSAGRVPTDTGYRFYVDNFSAENRSGGRGMTIPLEGIGDEIEGALKRSARHLAGATGLLALVSAPSSYNSIIKHIEVLHLQPDLIMIVIITNAGGISKKMIVYDEEVDPGLVKWADVYLNEEVCGLELGSRILRLRINEADLPAAEASFIQSLTAAFAGAADERMGELFVEGLPEFFSRLEEDGNVETHFMLGLIDRQEEVLKLLKAAITERTVYLRIGREMPSLAMQACSLVAANYGVAHRNLGTVGVLGPTRMDYGTVMGSVEQAARTLSRFVEERY